MEITTSYSLEDVVLSILFVCLFVSAEPDVCLLEQKKGYLYHVLPQGSHSNYVFFFVLLDTLWQ